jgi:hypothetical protein
MLSLRTRRYREAEHRAGLVDLAFGSAWERALSDTSDLAAIKRIVHAYLNGMLDRDAARRMATPPGQPVYNARRWDGEQPAAEHDLDQNWMATAAIEEALVERDY